jgi:alpha-N-arabinofuranosidase
MKKQFTFQLIALVIILSCISAVGILKAAETAKPTAMLRIKADQVTAKVSPMFFGLMTEEINYCYDGGLYAELIRNRIFKETPIRRSRRSGEETAPEQRTDGLMYWDVVQTGGSAASMSQDTTQPMNDALTNSLKLEVASAGENQRAGISNKGFWGISVRPNTEYKARIHAKGGNGFTGPLTLAIVSTDGKTIYAQTEIPKITDSYQRYDATLKTGNVKATADARFQIWAGGTGTIWFSLVSLFPPTYKNTPNGNRPDIMQLLADMKPSFLRFPGGNYLEGNTIATRFDWKKTIGDISQRPGHPCDAWGYWSSDGMGLLEFLEWCEDLNMEPVIGIYDGYSLRREWVEPGDDLKPYVQDGLDEIEYAIGDTSTTWGARRARDGHPKPFKLTYVEIGNEEFNRQSQYDARFAQFYDAIKAKYPDIKIIGAVAYGTNVLQTRKPDVYDDHFYRNSVQMQTDTRHYDDLDRNGPKVFVGEWATREGVPTPNMGAALSDAAWMTGMERNSDIVIMEAYAPLFVNVNPGGMQWATDLIGYDTLTSYGSPAYYAQKMFSLNHGDTVVAATLENVPLRQMEQPRRFGRRGAAGGEQPAPQKVNVPSLFCNVTRDSGSGTIYVKVVNVVGTAQPVHIQISGVSTLEPNGELVEMKGKSTEDTNSITEPTNIVPVTTKIDGLSRDFTRSFPPYSISVLKLIGK